MHRKIKGSQLREIDILVAAPFVGVGPDQRHEPGNNTQESMRKHRVVERLGLEGRAGIGVEGRVIGLLESKVGRLVDMYMIRVPIASHRIERQDDVRPELADVLDNPASHLVQGMDSQGVGIVIVGRSRHA